MKTVKKYTNELYRHLHYYATWLPGTPLELGTIGTMKNKEFTKKSHLRNVGIDFEIVEDTTKSDLNHTSQGAVTISPKLSGKIPQVGSALGQGDAGFTVKFSKQNAILFKAKGTVTSSIEDQFKLGRQIRKKCEQGEWDKSYVVITELVKADSATILISSSSKGKVELKARGNITATKLDIADMQLQLYIAFERDLSTKILAEQHLTPLFKVRRSRKSCK
jgi:hypothetical protein